MNATTLFSKLKTQKIPVNCLRAGDIIDLDYTTAVVASAIHHTSHPNWGECVVLEWESDDNTGSIVFPAYLPGSSNKWSNISIVVRDSLK